MVIPNFVSLFHTRLYIIVLLYFQSYYAHKLNFKFTFLQFLCILLCFIIHSFNNVRVDLLLWLVSVTANLDWAACSLPSVTDNCTQMYKFIKFVQLHTDTNGTDDT